MAGGRTKIISPFGPAADGFCKQMRSLERDLRDSRFHIERLCQTLIEVVVQKGDSGSITLGPPTMTDTSSELNVAPNQDGGVTITVVTSRQSEIDRQDSRAAMLAAWDEDN